MKNSPEAFGLSTSADLEAAEAEEDDEAEIDEEEERGEPKAASMIAAAGIDGAG